MRQFCKRSSPERANGWPSSTATSRLVGRAQRSSNARSRCCLRRFRTGCCAMPARTLDIQLVTWRPEPGLLDDLLASLTEAPIDGWTITLSICDNSADPELGT